VSLRIQNSLWTAVALVLLASSGWAQGMYSGAGGIMAPSANVKPPGLKNVGIEQKLNEQLPLNLVFRDETGRAVKLGDYFGKKPIILSLVYYRCPMLCSELLSGLEGSLKAMSFDVGKDFDIVTVSFDPKDTPADATEKKATVLSSTISAQEPRRAGTS
jgi:protein SCO1/2